MMLKSQAAAGLLLLAAALAAMPSSTTDGIVGYVGVTAFHVVPSSSRACSSTIKRQCGLLSNCNYLQRCINHDIILRMAEGEDIDDGASVEDTQDGETDDVEDAADSSASEDEETDADDGNADAKSVLSAYKSKLNTRRTSSEQRPGSTQTAQSIDVTMKFGGSSLANSERVERVANLIKDRIRPPDGSDEVPVRARAGELYN